MANQVYIAAGLSIKKSSGATGTTNKVYISAGLSPIKDVVIGGGARPSRVLTGPFEGPIGGPL